MSEEILDLPPPPPDTRVAYGPDPLQFGEVRVPAGPGPHPIAIVIHGGFWRSKYDLAHIGHLCAALTACGMATWSVEYRRIGDPGGTWPGTFQDVAAAADYVRELASRQGLDTARVVSLGHSAGGHLALWLAARHHLHRRDPGYSESPVRLHAAVSLAGVSDLDLAWKLRLGNGAVRELMRATPKQAPVRYRRASPAALLPLGVSQVLVHGTHDESVPYEMSQEYFSAARTGGDPVRLVTLRGADHFALIDPRSPQWTRVRDAIISAAS